MKSKFTSDSEQLRFAVILKKEISSLAHFDISAPWQLSWPPADILLPTACTPWSYWLYSVLLTTLLLSTVSRDFKEWLLENENSTDIFQLFKQHFKFQFTHLWLKNKQNPSQRPPQSQMCFTILSNREWRFTIIIIIPHPAFKYDKCKSRDWGYNTYHPSISPGS